MGCIQGSCAWGQFQKAQGTNVEELDSEAFSVLLHHLWVIHLSLLHPTDPWV